MQTVIGLFDDNSEAKRAVDDLMKSGFNRSEVTATRSSDSPSAQEMLTEARVPMQDVNFYNEGVRNGGTLVIVKTDDSKSGQAADILGRYKIVDVDARYQEFSSKGAQNIGLSQLDDKGQVLEVIEEELKVGKRQVQRGGIRVHTFVTERPVEEQVTLRDETVHVERRPVSRDVTNADASFKERTLEMTETDEEAVVSKVARVIEEVSIGKTVEDRTETVRDTVRRQDVDVEKVADARTMSGTTGYDTYASDFQNYYNTNLAKSGYTYEQYNPVFRYGYGLGTSDTYKGRDWNSIENDARTNWEARNPGTWEQFKGSVRYAWERATNKR